MLMVADHHMKHERHFVFADDRAWHRLWFRTDRPGVPLANLILRDSLVGLRHEAAVRFDRLLGDAPGPPPAGFLPTAYPARRPCIIPALLALLHEPARHGLTSHDVAPPLLHPPPSLRLRPAWQSSPVPHRTPAFFYTR